MAVLPEGVHLADEPSAVSLLRVARDRSGGLEVQVDLAAAGGRHPVGALLE